jgi:zinc resistance-associated protein
VAGFITKGRIPGRTKSKPNLRSHINMKTSKISLAVVLALALTMGLAASSWARPGGGGMGGGMGCGMMGAMNLTPDQAGKLFDLKEKFRNDTAQVRKQMMIKHAELAALWKAEKPDQTAITAKQKEVSALRDQMQEKRTAFLFEARKISPELGKGFSRGMWHGRGKGPGACPMVGPGGGKGPGGCPLVAPGDAKAPAPPAK